MEIHERINDLYRQESGFSAVQFEGDWWTWGDLAAVKHELDTLLKKYGIGEGQGVGIVLRQRPQSLAAYLGIIATRRCAVLLTPIQPDQSMAQEVRDLRLSVLVAEHDEWLREGLVDAAREAGTVGIEVSAGNELGVRLLDGLDKLGPMPRYEPAPDTAVTMLTSGTTGPPKRIPCAFATLRGEPPAQPKPPELRGVNIAAVPLVTLGGVLGMAASVWRGRPTSLMERFDVWKWAELIREHKPRQLGAPPAVIRMLLDAQVPPEYFKSGRVFTAGSAPLDQATADEFERVYGIPIARTYGATEFLGAITAFPMGDLKLLKTKRGSVGRAVQGCRIRIVDQETGEPLPAGAVGLLEADPPRRPADVPMGWMRTNDLARMDADGFVWIEGRADGVIIRGGFKIASEEVAALLIRHEAVSEAAVVGLPDQRLGQVPAAAVVLTPGKQASESELKDWVRTHKPGYAVPTRVVFVDALPRNAMLKIIPGQVRDLILETPAA